MQIQIIAKKTGLDRATIRYYEQEGLICPQRLENGYRDYSEKNLQDLLKIKLLRQIGLSVESIFQLIEGEGNLKSALENQLIVLKDHQAKIENAESVCKMILQDNVTFETIVPNRYLVLHSDKKHLECKVIDIPYTEFESAEIHPVRRFFGRCLDQILTSAILMLIFIVILRIRPFDDARISLFSIASVFVSMLLNALFLSFIGTTPGKFVVGIFLKTPEGKNMSFLDALRREWSVFRYGIGFGLPIYNLIRLYKSYQIHTAGKELEWDYDYKADVIYDRWDAKKGVVSAVLTILCLISMCYSVVDADYPKHRSTELTLAQFAENYNDYVKVDKNVATYLSEEGEWFSPYSIKASAKLDFNAPKEYWRFITDENQNLKEIKIELISNSASHFIDINKSSLVLYTLLISQPNADKNVAEDAVQKLSELTFIRDSKETHYNINEVTVHIQTIEPKFGEAKSASLIIDIKLP